MPVSLQIRKMASFTTARQNYILVDTSKDHIQRSPLQPHIVYDFICKCSLNPNNPSSWEWEAILLQEESLTKSCYMYCLCGQEIKNNYLLRNIETRKAFVVGCVCVKKIENIKIPTTKKICEDCGETVGRKKSDYCNICSIGHKEHIYIKKYQKTFTYKELMKTCPSYCEWIVQTEVDSIPFRNLKNWLLHFYEVIIE